MVAITSAKKGGDIVNELEIKRVPFLGTELIAARDSDGQIWAGVSYICNGIGLTKHQKDRQVVTVQTDEVLQEGCTKFHAGVFDPNNPTIALKLDFVPLWLAKISITPAMKTEHPELAETLKQYQLKAKDVLAAAFLPQACDKSNEPTVVQRVLTTDDYVRAASLVANCRNERLPYVLGFLEKGGFEIPRVEAAKPEEPELAQVINNAIDEHGLTVIQIGQITGIPRKQIYRYKNGSVPRGDRAEHMIQAIREVLMRKEAT